MKKKIFSLLVLLLTAVSGAWATEVTIGDQNSTESENKNKLPVNTFYNYSVTQQIYTAGEIGMGGYISAISFYYDYDAAFSMSGIQIFMKHVTKSAFSSNTDVEAISASDKVFEGTLAATTTGWVTITLDTPFEYDGTSNLLVCCYDATNGYPGSLYKFKQTNTATSQALSYYSDSYVPDVYDMSNYSGNKYIYTNRSNIKLEIGASASYALTKATDAEAHGSIVFKVDGNEVTTAAKGKTVNVEIKADDDWTVNTDKVEGIWYAAEAKARPRRAQTDIDIEKEIDLGNGTTDETTGAVTYSFTMIAANAEISAAYKKLMTNPDITISDIDDQTYNGQDLKPEVTVKDGETTLVKDTHYTVSYGTNGNAGTGTVTITGIGDNYAGTTTKEFKINQAQGSVYFNPMKYEKTFGDEDFTVEPTMVTGDGTLFFWSKNEDVATVDSETGLVHIVGTGIAYINAVMGATTNFTSASDYYVLTVKPKEIEYASGDITQDGNGYTVNLTEDEDHPNPDPLPDDVDLAELTYSRTLTAPGSSEGDATIDDQPANLYTICLPFAPETGTAVKYYTLSSVTGETLNFDEVSTPVSNTPYLVAVTGNVNFIESCTDQDVASMTINSSTVDGYTFNGTFAGMTNAEAQGKYILQAGNKWGKVTAENTGAFIPPFRAFIEGPASGARLLAGSIGGDGNTTGIKYIHTQDSNGSEQWYDLNGHRIEKPATKGVYIQDGRKVVVK